MWSAASLNQMIQLMIMLHLGFVRVRDVEQQQQPLYELESSSMIAQRDAHIDAHIDDDDPRSLL